MSWLGSPLPELIAGAIKLDERKGLRFLCAISRIKEIKQANKQTNKQERKQNTVLTLHRLENGNIKTIWFRHCLD